jgi:hypothetical protein
MSYRCQHLGNTSIFVTVRLLRNCLQRAAPCLISTARLSAAIACQTGPAKRYLFDTCRDEPLHARRRALPNRAMDIVRPSLFGGVLSSKDGVSR